MMDSKEIAAGNVSQQLDRLRNTINSLRNVSDELVKKISPVLLEPQPLPPTTGEAAVAPYQPLSPVYEALRTLERDVESIITSLDGVIKRVDL